jgi:molybdate transport system substrate-binding protein
MPYPNDLSPAKLFAKKLGKNARRCYFLALLIFTSAFLTAQPTSARTTKQLIIMADPSLSVALNLIARDYALKNNIAVTTIFEPTQAQINQIKEGAPCNIIISARRDLIDMMQQNGLINIYSRQKIVRNNLSLVASKYNNTNLNLTNLNNLNDMVVIPDAALTAEGFYAQQAMKHYNITEKMLKSHIMAESSFEAVKLIDDYAGIGIIFESDAKLFNNIKELDRFSSDSHNLLIYEAASIIGDDMQTSAQFLQYLNEKNARQIFRVNGFSPNF